ncbi:prolipoprotein diacylglyceryl transferase [Mariniblastus fucicola]|nr:prolipoprotein diacylglyceryl transferase family protein [Mariniblastus fucicola]
MLLALAAGFVLSRFSQKKLPLTTAQKFGLGVGGLIGAMTGAKLPFLFTDWDQFISGAAWFSDGKTILTGLVGGYLGVEAAKWAFEVKTKTGDSFLIPVAIAIAIGRVGCFFGSCCFGTPTEMPWGVVFPKVDAIARHPTQLYETMFHLSAAAIGWWAQSKNWCTGNRIKIYIASYAGYRFVSESIRPEARIFAGFTSYQIASLLIAGLMIWLWLRDVQSQESSGSE